MHPPDAPPGREPGKELPPPFTGPGGFLGHRTNKAFYAVILLLILVICALFAASAVTVQRLRAEQRQTLTELALVQSELEHYKEAYGTALADAQAFGRIYETNYTGNPEAEGAAAVAAPETAVHYLPEASVWEHYADAGIITDQCILTTKLVQTASDEVEIVLVASGKRQDAQPRLSVLMDGTLLDAFDIAEEQGIYRTAVLLPKGGHHLDIAYTNAAEAGPVTLPIVRIGDRTLENEVSVLDLGAGFGMFDCEQVQEGDTLKENGAMRFRIEKV